MKIQASFVHDRVRRGVGLFLIWCHKLIYIALTHCKNACKIPVDCDVKSGIDPLPYLHMCVTTSLSTHDLCARQRTLCKWNINVRNFYMFTPCILVSIWMPSLQGKSLVIVNCLLNYNKRLFLEVSNQGWPKVFGRNVLLSFLRTSFDVQISQCPTFLIVIMQIPDCNFSIFMFFQCLISSFVMHLKSEITCW